MTTAQPSEATRNGSGSFALRLRAVIRHAGVRLANGYRLQVILFVALVVLSAVPVFLLATWVRTDALEKEVRLVTEKHLLLAKNLGGILERYVTDVKAVFRVAAYNGMEANEMDGIDGLLRSLNFCYVAIVGPGNKLDNYVLMPPEGHADFRLTAPLLDEFRGLLAAHPGETVISDLMILNEEPLFFVLRAFADGTIAIGALETTFLREVQQAIVFGERGHSMIVDAKGRVVAHPDKGWEAQAKDASKLSVVQKMMRGETGVATFYSPPMQADMIAGHTSVPGVGWGVMVPQPFSELEARVSNARNIAVGIALAGILASALIGWLLAKYLSAPIVAVARAASNLGAGGMHTRVSSPPRYSPRELRTLANSFNRMVDQLEEREARLRTARDEAEAANRAKTEFLANISH
jgi:HAMP domain-containing protein